MSSASAGRRGCRWPAYLPARRRPPRLGDTKLTFNAGKGSRSRASARSCRRCLAGAARHASALGIEPVGPERSRSVDVGIEQGWRRPRRACALAYFNNEFSIFEVRQPSVLPQLGVPTARRRRRLRRVRQSQVQQVERVELSARRGRAR
jgi:hypothetical protein